MLDSGGLICFQYRHIGAPFIDENVAGNQIKNVRVSFSLGSMNNTEFNQWQAPTTIPTDMAGIATALRHALVQAREPSHIHDWTAVASNYMLEIANAGKSFFFGPRDHVVTVNSNTV